MPPGVTVDLFGLFVFAHFIYLFSLKMVFTIPWTFRATSEQQVQVIGAELLAFRGSFQGCFKLSSSGFSNLFRQLTSLMPDDLSRGRGWPVA